MKENLRAYLELTVAMVLVGSSVVVGKLMSESLPIFLAGGLSSAIGAAILVPVLLRREGGLLAVSGRDLMILFLQALTGIFLFRVLLLWGLLFTTAAEGGVITGTTPAVVGLISFFFLKEKLGPRVVVSIALSVLGIVALNVLGSDTGAVRGPASLLGNLLVFGAVISEALFTIFGKAASERVTPLATAASASVLSLALFLPLGLYQAVGFDFSSAASRGCRPARRASSRGRCPLAPWCSPTSCWGSRSLGRTSWESPHRLFRRFLEGEFSEFRNHL